MARALSASSRSVWGDEPTEVLAANEGLGADEDFDSGFLSGEVLGEKEIFRAMGKKLEQVLLMQLLLS